MDLGLEAVEDSAELAELVFMLSDCSHLETPVSTAYRTSYVDKYTGWLQVAFLARPDVHAPSLEVSFSVQTKRIPKNSTVYRDCL